MCEARGSPWKKWNAVTREINTHSDVQSSSALGSSLGGGRVRGWRGDGVGGDVGVCSLCSPCTTRAVVQVTNRNEYLDIDKVLESTFCQSRGLDMMRAVLAMHFDIVTH